MINLRPGVWLPQDDSRLRVLESGMVDAPATRASTITADQPAVHHRRRAVRHEAVRPEHDAGSEDASPVELARVDTAEVEKFYNIARGTLTGDEGPVGASGLQASPSAELMKSGRNRDVCISKLRSS